MLGLLAFVGLCLIAALFPTLTAYVIFAAALFYGVKEMRDRHRK